MKQGTWFKDWLNLGDEPYYHPFSLPEGFDTVNLAEHWLNGEAGNASFAASGHTSVFGLRTGASTKATWHPRLCLHRQLWLPPRRRKVCRVIDTNAVSKLGVTHIEADVCRLNTVMIMVTSAAAKNRASRRYLRVICLSTARVLKACSWRALSCFNEVPAQYLFNNAALAVQVPYDT